MDLDFRAVMTSNGLPPHGSLITPPTPTTSDVRTGPRAATDSEPCEMEPVPPITGKRRGGSRKACNECKQQKVSSQTSMHPCGYPIPRPMSPEMSDSGLSVAKLSVLASIASMRHSPDARFGMLPLSAAPDRLQSRAILQEDFETEVCTLMPLCICLFLTIGRRNAEMEKEISDLRRRLATNSDHPQAVDVNASDELSQCSEDVFCPPNTAVSNTGRPMPVPEPQPLATPMTMHRDRSILSQDDKLWTLEDISLSKPRVARLFEQ